MNKVTLVLGASLKPERYSNIAVIKLLHHGHHVKAFGLKAGEIGSVCIDTILVAYEDIETVTLYLNPTRQKAYYDYIVNLKPKRVIFNPGTENPEFYKLLTQNKINYEIACTLVLLRTNKY